jgi:hypothetical protein
MMLPSFFTYETGTRTAPALAIYLIWAGTKAVQSNGESTPVENLGIGHNDLSTGGAPRRDPDNHAILTQVTEPASIQKRRE